jgi:hypothetical protein
MQTNSKGLYYKTLRTPNLRQNWQILKQASVFHIVCRKYTSLLWNP